MPELSSSPSTAPRRRRFVTAACGWREGRRGGYVWHFFHGSVHLLRATPPSLLRMGSGTRFWRRSLHLPFELSMVLRELQHDDDVAAGRRALASIPIDERPERRPYRVHRRAAVRRFFAQVPTPVQRALDGWSTGSFALFRFLMTTPPALDLMDSEDGARLAWCLANAHELRANPYQTPERDLLRRGRACVRRRRRDALAFCGLPPTQAALAALAKVPRAALGSSRVDDVRAVLAAPELYERARHLPVWNHALDVLTVELHRHVHMSFLLELAGEATPRGRVPSVATELRETLAMLARCGQRPPVFRSRAHLRAVHDDALRRTSPLLPWWSRSAFPPLPIALGDRERASLRHLDDSAALVREGSEMHHCLGSVPAQHALARLGAFCAFAMTKPSRLTLAFEWSSSARRWSVYDLRGPANRLAGAAASEIAQGLLERFDRAGPPAPLRAPDGTLDEVAVAAVRAAEHGGPNPLLAVDDHTDDDAADDRALDGAAGDAYLDELPF